MEYIESKEAAQAKIVSKIESQLSKDRREQCYAICSEIVRFGVSQRQVLHIIYLLAREIENPEAMVAIMDAVNSWRMEIPLVEEDTTQQQHLVLEEST